MRFDDHTREHNVFTLIEYQFFLSKHIYDNYAYLNLTRLDCDLQVQKCNMIYLNPSVWPLNGIHFWGYESYHKFQPLLSEYDILNWVSACCYRATTAGLNLWFWFWFSWSIPMNSFIFFLLQNLVIRPNECNAKFIKKTVCF